MNELANATFSYAHKCTYLYALQLQVGLTRACEIKVYKLLSSHTNPLRDWKMTVATGVLSPKLYLHIGATSDKAPVNNTRMTSALATS